MNLMENNRGMTLDSRTFVECSRRMQSCNPTLPRNADLIQTPLGSFEMAGNESLNKDSAKPDSKNRITLPKIRVKCPTPTPPPRKKKGQQPSSDQAQQQQEDVGKNSGEISVRVPVKAVQLSTSSMTRSLRFYSSNKSSNHHDHKNMKHDISHDAIFSRPVQFIMDWMTNIANNLDCPPV